MAILQNVRLDVNDQNGLLLATDLEMGVRMHVEGFEVMAPGSVILPTNRMGSILRELSDEHLTIEIEGNKTMVRGERSQFSLPVENPAEFPPIPEFDAEKYHEVSARSLRELIRRTEFATDNESGRYALGGVLLEFAENHIVAVGTDGRRLAKMQVSALSVGGHTNEGASTIVPGKAMKFIERSLADADSEVQISARANDILVKTSRMTIYSRLLEGRFPRWRDVFPQRNDTIKLDLPIGPLAAAVRQAAIVSTKESQGVDFMFSDGLLTLQGQSSELGNSKVELPIAYDGKNVEVTLNPKYVTDFLGVLEPSATVSFDIKDGESAVVCSTDDGYGYVIMPLARDR
jgi:DNA polymerase-3 subunit beta